MGFYSFKTSDTNKSISNIHSARKPFTVYMVLPDFGYYTEKNYNGYGDFGGIEFYELIAKLNGLNDRSEAIELHYTKFNGSLEEMAKAGYQIPKFFESLENTNKWDELPYPVSCPEQGFFYSDEEEIQGEDTDQIWTVGVHTPEVTQEALKAFTEEISDNFEDTSWINDETDSIQLTLGDETEIKVWMPLDKPTFRNYGVTISNGSEDIFDGGYRTLKGAIKAVKHYLSKKAKSVC